MALELNGTTGVSLVQDGVVTAADLASGAITASALPAGSIVAAKYDSYTAAASYSLASGDAQNVTELSITHTATGSNQIILIASISAYSLSSNSGFVFLSDGALVGDRGDAAGNRIRVVSGAHSRGEVSAQYATPMNGSVQFTPSSGSHTYTIALVNVRTSTDTVYINRSSGDTDQESYYRSMSSLILLEVAV
mgnify:CR=1 FL=1